MGAADSSSDGALCSVDYERCNLCLCWAVLLVPQPECSSSSRDYGPVSQALIWILSFEHIFEFCLPGNLP